MKMLVLVYGCFCILLSFLVEYLGAVLQGALTIFGVVGGPVMAVFTLGIFIPFIDQKVGTISQIILHNAKVHRLASGFSGFFVV